MSERPYQHYSVPKFIEEFDKSLVEYRWALRVFARNAEDIDPDALVHDKEAQDRLKELGRQLAEHSTPFHDLRFELACRLDPEECMPAIEVEKIAPDQLPYDWVRETLSKLETIEKRMDDYALGHCSSNWLRGGEFSEQGYKPARACNSIVHDGSDFSPLYSLQVGTWGKINDLLQGIPEAEAMRDALTATLSEAPSVTPEGPRRTSERCIPRRNN